VASEPRRVLLILGTSTGGIGQHVRSLAFGLVSRGHRVVVAAPVQADEVFDFASTGARFVEAAIGVTPSPKDLVVARQVARWVRGADVVHAHGFRAGLVALSAGAGAAWPVAGVRRASVPLVVTWHNQVLDGGVRGQVMHRVEQSVARGATLNLGASTDLVERAVALGGRAELGAVAAPTPTVVKAARDEVRQAIGVGDEPMVLAVGRLHGQKDYPTLLSAMAQLQSRVPQPVLVIAGDGPDADSIAELSGSLAVRSRMLGRRADVADLMNAADVFVLSSVWEARALVVQEAVLAGLPVVATSVGGIPELVGSEALLVPPRDPNALAAAIRDVLDHPEVARDRAELARALAATWPDENEAVERVLDAYDTVCEPQVIK
jgi:glycosyltransferase involved in cell wall biosynthesis